MTEQVEEMDDQREQSDDGSEEGPSGESGDAQEELVEVSRAELEELREERDKYEEKYLRKTADLDNLRKRKEQEKEKLRRFAHTDLLSDLLEVIDNVGRALDSLEFENEDVEEGVRMIEDQLSNLLDKYDVEAMDAEGEYFDPHKHEGMMREERDDLDKQTVVEVFQEGYQLHDRVLRPAQVKVGVPVSDGDESNPDQTDGE